MCTNPADIGKYFLLPRRAVAIQYTGTNLGQLLEFIKNMPGKGENMFKQVETDFSMFPSIKFYTLNNKTQSAYTIPPGFFCYYLEDTPNSVNWLSEVDFLQRFGPVEEETPVETPEIKVVEPTDELKEE